MTSILTDVESKAQIDYIKITVKFLSLKTHKIHVHFS